MVQGWTDRRAGRWVALGTLGLMACSSEAPEAPGTPQGSASVESAARCEVRPPFEPHFEPEVEWAWTASPLMPTHTNVNMTPVVVDVSGDGVPDVVFNSFEGWNFKTNGVLRAISGADGSDLWAVTDPALRVRGSGSIAAGDLDGDGKVELCTVPENAQGIICFEHTGAFKFRAAGPWLNWGGVSLADLEGDGTVEIIAGNHVYDSGGTLKWVGSDGVGGANDTGPLAFAADLDGDGKQEVVNGRAIYRHDGTLKCRAESLSHGLAAVGNFDADPAGEVVVTWKGKLALMEDDCTVRWLVERLDWGVGGPPTIADFDADGQAEVGVAGADWYSVFEADGTEKWRHAIQDHSSNVSGATTFDFEGDGRVEVVYADEKALRILDGATGEARFETSHSSCTAYENPVVVDVDGDGNAEIVVAQNTACDLGSFHGIRVFRDKKDGWVSTRRIWNQHAYSVTNVNDDGSIPARPATNWLTPGLNTFRTNSQGSGQGTPFAAPDLVVGEVTAACDSGGGVTLDARVRNQGDAAASAGVRVAFYRGSTSTSGTLLGVATLADKVDPGAEVRVELGMGAAPGGRGEVFVVVDDDGSGTGRELECREDNNTVSARVALECSVNEPPVALCRDVTVSADATCRATASVDDGSHDPDGRPGPFTVTQAAAGPFGLGRHAVTLTASDGEDSAVCTGTVTVVDTTLPHIVCPAPQVLECTAGGAKATYTARAEDNCGPVEVACTPPTGNTFPLGRTVVDCNATDGSGNACGCGFTVTVRDTRPPVLGSTLGVELRPADHQYRTVTLAECAGAAQDACMGELPLDRYGRIVRVTSDESEDAGGSCDGATCDDMDVRVNATSVQLRAERDDTGDGRVYTVHYVVEDPSGNKAEGRCTVGVPRDTYGRQPAQDSGPKYCVGQGCATGMGGSPLCP